MKTSKEILEKRGHFFAMPRPFSSENVMEAMEEYADQFKKENHSSISEREIDLAYFTGVFNASGIDGLQKEIDRLKKLGTNPHDMIIFILKK